MTKNKKLRALCLSGGGSRGAFAVGALMHLMHNLNMHYDIITGISVGALNGSFLAQYKKGEEHKAIEELHKIWCGVNNRTIWKHWFPFGMVHSLWKKSLYQSGPLEKLVDEMLDTKRVANSGKQLRVGFVELNSGTLLYFTEKHSDLKNAVKASAAFPSFFKPVKIKDYGLCLDGGIEDVVPLKAAIDLGAEHITIITTSPIIPPTVRGIEKMNTVEISKRVVDIVSNKIATNNLKRFFEINRLVKEEKIDNKRFVDYTLIQPDECLIPDPLDFNPKEIKEMIAKGYIKAVEKTKKREKK